MTEKVKISPD